MTTSSGRGFTSSIVSGDSGPRAPTSEFPDGMPQPVGSPGRGARCSGPNGSFLKLGTSGAEVNSVKITGTSTFRQNSTRPFTAGRISHAVGTYRDDFGSMKLRC